MSSSIRVNWLLNGNLLVRILLDSRNTKIQIHYACTLPHLLGATLKGLYYLFHCNSLHTFLQFMVSSIRVGTAGVIKGSQAEIRPSAAYTLMRKVTCTLSSHSRQSPVWFRDLRNAVRALGCTENQQSLSYGVYVLSGRSTCSSSKHLGGDVSKEVTPGMDLGSV